MISRFYVDTPSPKTLLLTRLSIVLVVIVTGLVSVLLVRSQLERHEMPSEPIPIAEIKTWADLGR